MHGDPKYKNDFQHVDYVNPLAYKGGKVIFISDEPGVSQIKSQSKPWATITLPVVNPVVAPILYAVPVQLLAYHAAVAKGTDVDQPRNLAKSVTVE